MATSIDALKIYKIFRNSFTGAWSRPEQFGPDGWKFVDKLNGRSVIVTCAPMNGVEWIHTSMAGADNVPTYAELALLHRAVFGDGWAYQVFAPSAEHVNIHATALHLFGRLDGAPALPDFTFGTGSI